MRCVGPIIVGMGPAAIPGPGTGKVPAFADGAIVPADRLRRNICVKPSPTPGWDSGTLWETDVWIPPAAAGRRLWPVEIGEGGDGAGGEGEFSRFRPKSWVLMWD